MADEQTANGINDLLAKIDEIKSESTESVVETVEEEIVPVEKEVERKFISGRFKGRAKKNDVGKVISKQSKAEILAEYGGLESNIPITHSYWRL